MDAIILAAGTGSRMKAGYNKMFIKINGKEILWYTLKRFCESSVVDRVILVTGVCDMDECCRISSGFNKDIVVIEGGSTRQESSYKGVSASDNDYVIIHDGARPLVSEDDILKTADAAVKYNAAAVGAMCVDTLKMCDENGFIDGTVDRSKTFKIFTPQIFKREMLLGFHEKALEDGVSVTDDSALCEYCGQKVKFVEGSQFNLKMTTREDLLFAEVLLKTYN